MAARILFYAQELLSYGNSKGEKLQNSLAFSRQVCGDRVFSNGVKNGTICQQELMVGKMVV